jgi:hypothetical protein
LFVGGCCFDTGCGQRFVTVTVCHREIFSIRLSISALAAASQRDKRSTFAGSFSAATPRSRTQCRMASIVVCGVESGLLNSTERTPRRRGLRASIRHTRQKLGFTHGN